MNSLLGTTITKRANLKIQTLNSLASVYVSCELNKERPKKARQFETLDETDGDEVQEVDPSVQRVFEEENEAQIEEFDNQTVEDADPVDELTSLGPLKYLSSIIKMFESDAYFEAFPNAVDASGTSDSITSATSTAEVQHKSSESTS
ncbi:unnamed protein product [Ambrosiozyma monospora]|uniref:Unnamed protein product n=1 Tax=Ambrosiozyma monospora TaxID=43982 RepID=A0ACB5SYR6_AMBMO|nr:unnamed protein product [Ambrosiozyma monospora]